MARLVFNYRNASLYTAVGFVTFFSAALVHGLISWWRDGSFYHGNELLFIFAAVALTLFGLNLYLALFCLNERVEVVNEKVLWFDFLGRRRVKGSLMSAIILSTGRHFIIPGIEVTTDDGQLTIYKSIRKYGLIRRIIEQGRTHQGHVSASMPISSYVPSRRTCTYRWSYPHVMSLFLLGFSVLLLRGFFGGLAAKGSSALDVPWELYVGLFFFFGGVLAMQLKVWSEYVQIGPDGIVWTDLLGRKSSARLDEIVELSDVADGEGRRVHILTTQGSIELMDHSWGLDELLFEVRQLLNHRGGTSATSSASVGIPIGSSADGSASK